MSEQTKLSIPKDDLFERAFASLIGLAIGDSIGDQARSQENKAVYGITRDMYENTSWSTDDTEFALLVALEMINSKGELTTQHVVDAWMEHVVAQTALGEKGGESEKGAVNNLRRGVMPPYSGIDNSFNDSDGAAMRIAPIGIACAGDPDRAAKLAAIDASISHDRNGVWGAQAVAAAVAMAMIGASTEQIISTARSVIPDDSWLGRWFDIAMHIVDDANGDLWKAWNPLHHRLRAEYRASCAEAISETFAIFRLTKGEFVDGVLAASNFGRDSDTLAAIVGALAGAKNGIKVVPEDWIMKVRRPTGRCLAFTSKLDIQALALDLAQLISIDK
ncbi:MAG: ADP-ribosylglycohydrolase family protein [Anaerolineales bacterium]|nr:ADP-ribosylglycohydrolase family protein [Anaerolineales bacterium]